MYKIYVLIDPRDVTNYRYVGWTCCALQERLYNHICEARRKPHTYRARWVNKLLREDVRPTIQLIEETDDYAEAEMRWIAQLRQQGYRLTNGTDGGKGVLGARWKLTPEQRQKIKDRPPQKATPERVERMRQQKLETKTGLASIIPRKRSKGCVNDHCILPGA